VTLLAQSQRERRATAGHALARLRALAADPHLYAMGVAVTEGNARDHRIGGRPSAYPDWALVLFGAGIRVMGSASATGRALADRTVWADVTLEAERLLGADAVATLPSIGPNRDHWSYFCKRRITPGVLKQLVALQRDLAVDRATEVGLLNPVDHYSAGGYAATTSSASTGRYSAARFAPWTPNGSIDTPDSCGPSAKTRPDSGTAKPARTTWCGAPSSRLPRSAHR
jgi:hypothetical protein